MKKNVVQDIIPPQKTIRNIELPSKARHIEKKLSVKADFKESDRPAPPDKTPSYTYEYEEPVKPSRKILYVSIGLFVLAVLFGLSVLFKSAQIRVTPRQETKALNENFKALKNLSISGLGFQIVTTTKNAEKKVIADNQQEVLKKAQGKIVIYNNYGTQPQRLVVNTRFETGEGLIFRTISAVTVPGTQIKDGKTVAGSVEVTVIADRSGSEYNIGLKDFTIPGFKGDPRYTKIYARSKTEMSGGFSGFQKIVKKEVIDATDKDLEAELRSSLAKDITSQIPENFILYPDSLSYKFGETSQIDNSTVEGDSASSAILQKKGIASAVIFDRGSLTTAIASKLLPDLAQNTVKITNLPDLKFAYQTGVSFDPSTTTLLNFNLSGQVNFVWVFDENKLKSDVLGLSKKNASVIIGTYESIKEAWVETRPFWNQTMPTDPKKVTVINTLTK